jgi:hypothetical protein
LEQSPLGGKHGGGIVLMCWRRRDIDAAVLYASINADEKINLEFLCLTGGISNCKHR